MPFVKGQSGNPNGRQKGTPNKLNQQAKEAIAVAADGLGGTDRLIAWAKEDPKNEAAFWTSIYPKLIPLQVNGNHHVETVDRTRLLQEAEERVRAVFGDEPGPGLGYHGTGLPH